MGGGGISKLAAIWAITWMVEFIITLESLIGIPCIYLENASGKVTGGIVVVETKDIVIERVGNGGGSEADEESNTIIEVIGEVDMR